PRLLGPRLLGPRLLGPPRRPQSRSRRAANRVAAPRSSAPDSEFFPSVFRAVIGCSNMTLLRSRHFRSRLVALLVATSIVPASLPVYAQKAGVPSKVDLEKAKKAFFEGIAFEEQKKWDEALKRFEAVAKVRMTPQVRFHIALCKENLGMLVEALHDFE